MAVEFLPYFVALAATIVGVFGKGWDEEKQGWQRLTVKGRVIIGLALATFAYSVYQAVDAHHQRQERLQKEALLRKIVRDDIIKAVDEILTPLKTIDDNSRKLVDPSSFVDAMVNTPSMRLKAMKSEAFLTTMKAVKVIDCPFENAARGCTWAGFFSNAASQGDSTLKDAVTRYSTVLSPMALKQIQSVRDHKMISIFRSMPGNLRINLEQGNPNSRTMTIDFLIMGPYPPSEYYLPFLDLLDGLTSEVAIKE